MVKMRMAAKVEVTQGGRRGASPAGGSRGRTEPFRTEPFARILPGAGQRGAGSLPPAPGAPRRWRERWWRETAAKRVCTVAGSFYIKKKNGPAPPLPAPRIHTRARPGAAGRRRHSAPPRCAPLLPPFVHSFVHSLVPPHSSAGIPARPRSIHPGGAAGEQQPPPRQSPSRQPPPTGLSRSPRAAQRNGGASAQP